MGRHTKLDDDLQDRFVAMLRAGHSRKLAAQVVGISEPTVYRWLNGTTPVCRRFQSAVVQAEAEAIVRVISYMVARTRWSTRAARRLVADPWRGRVATGLRELRA